MEKKDSQIENIDQYIEKQIELKLNSLLETLPDKQLNPNNIKPIYEYTIGELYKNTLQTSIDIINEIVDIYGKKDYINSSNYYNILLSILLKDNRKVYVGILLIIFSFIIYFIDGASI